MGSNLEFKNTEVAAQFLAGASGNLATVDLGLTYTVQGAVNVYLYGNASGLPGTNLGLLGSGTPTAALGTTSSNLVSFAVAGTIPVTMGTTYWLVLKPTNTSMADAWNLSSPAVPRWVGVSFNDSTWAAFVETLPAFRITAQGAAGAPDSGDTILLLLGSATALFVLQRMLPRQRC